MAFLELNEGVQLYYETIAGSEDRPCLVYLHEGLGCVRLWREFPAALCRKTGCPGLLYDRQGYGASSGLRESRTASYMHDYADHELFTVLEKLLPDRKYILIGHSDGGTIALLHGALNPPRLAGIITIAAHVFVEEITLQGIRAAKSGWERGRMRGLYRYHGEKADSVFAAWADTWLADSFREWNIESLLPAITKPLLVIQGDEDCYGSPLQVDKIISLTSATARRCIVEGCGHSPHTEAPEMVLDTMIEFIDAISIR